MPLIQYEDNAQNSASICDQKSRPVVAGIHSNRTDRLSAPMPFKIKALWTAGCVCADLSNQ